MVKRKAEHATWISPEVRSLEPESRPAEPPIYSEPTVSSPLPTSSTNSQRIPNADVAGSGFDVASPGVGGYWTGTGTHGACWTGPVIGSHRQRGDRWGGWRGQPILVNVGACRLRGLGPLMTPWTQFMEAHLGRMWEGRSQGPNWIGPSAHKQGSRWPEARPIQLCNCGPGPNKKV